MTFYIPSVKNNIIQYLHIKYYDSDDDVKPFINTSLYRYLLQIKKKITENQESWDSMKKYTNLYEFIHTPVNQYKRSVCVHNPISRSYFKMIEMLNTHNLLKKYNKSIRTFHLAEGPGGFIEAISSLRKRKDDCYYGMTLIDEKNKNVPGWNKTKSFLLNNRNESMISTCCKKDCIDSSNLKN